VKLSKKRFLLGLIICFSLIYKVQADDNTVQLAQASGIPQGPISAMTAGMEGKISLDLRNIEVVDALKFLSMKAGINVITTKNVAGRVTLMLQDVPAKDAFDMMLRSNGLAYSKEDQIYNVMTEDEYKAIFGRKFADIRQVKIFRIKFAIPEQVFSLMDALKSDIGRVLVEPDSGTALIMDTPQKIQEIENAMLTLEQKNAVRIFPLKYAKAKEVEEQLKTQLDAKKAGSVKADERNNQVIVQTMPERMASIETLIKGLDRKTKEVLLDTEIVKIALSDNLQQGVEWQGLTGLASQFGMAYLGATPFSVLQPATNPFQTRNSYLKSIGGQVGAYPFSGNGSNVSGATPVTPGVMHVGIVGKNVDFDALVQYVKTLGKTQVLSTPKIAVVNNQEAKIHVGQRQAYVTSTTTTGQTTTTVSEEVTFVDVGIQLSVTPIINDDGYVTMKIKPEISSVVDTLTTPSGNKIPIIDTSVAETTVMVKDGSTIIIGGLRREDKISSSAGIPFLSKIPILGFFFKNGSDSIQRTELLVLMTPHIVTGDTLVTGNEHEPEFGNEPGKQYKDYSPFVEKPEFKSPKEVSENKLEPKGAPEKETKAYREYSSLKEEKKYVPTIKGDEDNE